jgi:hypothetical protein
MISATQLSHDGHGQNISALSASILKVRFSPKRDYIAPYTEGLLTDLDVQKPFLEMRRCSP